MVKVQQRVDCDQIIKEIEEIEAGGLHGQLPLVWKSAKNWTVRDQLGQYYLDFTSSIFVANCGHSAVIKEIKLQLRRQLIHSYTFPTVTKLEFLKRLKAFLPGFCEKIFLASAGSEVTSWALTLMRAKTGKPIVIHFDGAFHGKTGHAVELQDEELSLPFPGEDTDWNAELEATLEKYKDRIGGIMFESYQGWSAKFMSKEYVQRMVQWARVNYVPVCFDEIQGGFWRTGKKFAYEWYEVEPDLICMGKGLGGGVPLSALAGRKDFFDYPGLSSTHSGNPLCCAAGTGALKAYDKLDKVELAKKAELMRKYLKMFQERYRPYVCNSRNRGLLGAVIFCDEVFATEVAEACLRNGLIVVKTGRESVKIGPPLTIPLDILGQGMSLLGDAIQECYEKRVKNDQRRE